jgi:outer membrane biogenesis lipoprotein LolB
MPKFKRRDRNQNTRSMEINELIGTVPYHQYDPQKTNSRPCKTRVSDPDPHKFEFPWIRIQEAKITHKNRIPVVIFMFEVLDVLF